MYAHRTAAAVIPAGGRHGMADGLRHTYSSDLTEAWLMWRGRVKMRPSRRLRGGL